MKNKLINILLDMRNGMLQNDTPNILLQKNEKDVSVYTHNYNNDNESLHKLNIYVNNKIENKLPLLIDIHGGAWVYGDKDTNGLLCMDFAKRGFITMSMSYRIMPEHGLLDMVSDIFESLHYLYTLKDKYPIDFNNVAIMGDSAGGHLNLLCNAINNSKELQKYYNVKKLPFNISCIIGNHPAPYMHPPLGNHSLELNEVYYNMCYGENYKNALFYPYISLDGYGKYLNKNTKILIITSKDDDIVRHQAFESIKYFQENNIPYELFDELSDCSEHVYNVTRPFRDISIKCNNYIEKFIKENLRNK